MAEHLLLVSSGPQSPHSRILTPEGMEDMVRMGPVSQDNVQCRDADSSCCERNTEANNNVVMG